MSYWAGGCAQNAEQTLVIGAHTQASSSSTNNLGDDCSHQRHDYRCGIVEDGVKWYDARRDRDSRSRVKQERLCHMDLVCCLIKCPHVQHITVQTNQRQEVVVESNNTKAFQDCETPVMYAEMSMRVARCLLLLAGEKNVFASELT